MLFREPDGRPKSRIFSLLSFISVLEWVYFGVVLDSPQIMLFLSVAFAPSGFAESPPPNRQRSAGVLRTLGLGVLVVVVALIMLAPGPILG